LTQRTKLLKLERKEGGGGRYINSLHSKFFPKNPTKGLHKKKHEIRQKVCTQKSRKSDKKVYIQKTGNSTKRLTQKSRNPTKGLHKKAGNPTKGVHKKVRKSDKWK